MRRGVYIVILAGVAAVCVALHVLEASAAGLFSAALAFPFEQLGLALRALSLCGAVGNVLAILCYAVICLSPGALLLRLRKKRKLYAEDGLMALLSIALFAVLYLMINTALIERITMGAAGLAVGKAMLGGALYSILCGYIVLRALRLFFTGGLDRLMRYLYIMLSLLGVLFVCVIFGVCVSSLLESISTLKAGNTGNERLLDTTYFFLGLQFLLDALPYVMDLLIVMAGLRLLKAMLDDRYCAQAVEEASRLSRLCRAALTITVLSNIGFNLLQLLFAQSLMVVNGSLEIPVFSMAFVLSVLLMTRFITENKRLKDDNDLFV